MERKSNCQNKITKVGRLYRRIIKKLGYSKKINRNNKKSYKEAIWQEKKESIRTEDKRQYMAGGQKYSIESTLKEVRPEKI